MAGVLGIAVTIAIAVSLLAGGMGILSGGGKPAAKADETLTLVDAVVGNVVGEAAKVFFESAKADLPADAADLLKPLVDLVKEGKASRVFLSGFHDATGSRELNAELAKQRAINVRAHLLAQGLTPAQVSLVKPAETTGDGSNREARRVEATAVKD